MPAFSGGGSHFSGGSSGGGGSHFDSGGSHFDGGRHGRHGGSVFFGPIIIHHGYYQYESSGETIKMPATFAMKMYRLFVILSYIFLFAGILLMAIFSGISKSDIEEDYVYYQTMVYEAENNINRQVNGTIVSINEKLNKYYIEYTFITEQNYRGSGATYSIYTEEDLEYYGYYLGGSILLATDLNVNEFISQGIIVDSVPMDFVDFEPEDDAEWSMACKYEIGFNIGVISLLAALPICLISACIIYRTCKKQINEFKKEQTEPSLEQATVTSESATPKKQRRCRYCGSLLNDNEKSCPHCGASGDIEE